ncbi:MULTISPECIES: VCBS repeat-containing protein [unclassified Actinoplanes]|uniref:FG-GAP repeat domain-containing protein n=1 Tax=unclassified Actinoplanes TaxID=2626549 RepID=UPI0002F7F7DA|nr:MULTISPECIES: VCBS repeat-containing protein [unclassified Actinoplanes]
MTLASVSALLPTSAQAAPLPAASTCAGDTGTAADRVVADRLRPSMTGRRLGTAVSPRAVACARAIIGIVQQRGLGPRAAVIAVTTAITESTLTNHVVSTDHDSLGLFEQRPSQGWGRAAQLVDPVYATNAFLTAMLRKFPGDSWMGGDIGAICQRVQTSALPGAYAFEVHDAQLIVSALWAVAPDPAPAVPTAAATASASAAASGPFTTALASARPQLGALNGRHGLAMADWNGDKHPDLMIINGVGAATGKTEIRIMDGATNFSRLLLITATALGPTDERHAYAVTDYNGDGKPDLVVTQKSGTASGHTEVRVVDGASNFQRLLVETATVLGPTDDRYQFSVADWNADGHPDLLATQTTGTASGKVEVQVLDGATNFQQASPAVVTAQPAGDGVRVAVTDWNGDRKPDLVTTVKTDLSVLDGAAGLTKTLATAKVPGDSREQVLTDWNADGKQDLAAVQTEGTAEISVLGG